MNEIDLHVHTTASDGILDPARLVVLAASKGLRIIAVTDHDSTDGISRASEAAKKYDLEVIPGIELGTDTPAGKVHVLGYFVDPENPTLRHELQKLRSARTERAHHMLEKLAAQGCTLSWRRLAEVAGNGVIGRPHFARALLEVGYVSSIQEAFELYIGDNGPAYVQRPYRLEPLDAVKLIGLAGGVAVLAHPLTMNGAGDRASAQPLTLLPELCEAGLAGLEVYYAGYPPWACKALERIAEHYGLVATGGSDFHGEEVKPDHLLGGVSVSWQCVERLKCHRDRSCCREERSTYLHRRSRTSPREAIIPHYAGG